METKFTKGPWVARTELFGDLKTALIYVDGGGFDISGSPNCMANAHLIASAPEMYEMLLKQSELMGFLDEQTHPNIELDAVKHEIDKLLSKARGQHKNNN